MARPPASTLMTALGFTRAQERLYEQVLAQSGRRVGDVAEALMVDEAELLRDLAPLAERDVVRRKGDRLLVSGPAEVLRNQLTALAEGTLRARERLEDVAAAVPFLAASSARADEAALDQVRPIDGEVSSGGEVLPLMREMVTQSRGDLLWLRPDQWRHPRDETMVELVELLTAAGRRSRAIYPVAALQEARHLLTARARAGEEIRILPSLPTRLLIVGTTHAILPEPLGCNDEPRSVVRQRGLVQALTLWFESLWNSAAPVPSLDRSEALADQRRFLLDQLAAGAQDEQIARRLGVSLRTVRRRVADAMEELGVETRFQAGAEAVRRGWL
ncbi:helix-turn-helix domain-containing protein [Nocardioides ferulae]|uniref:helix-turn-helix domain-containing protein n=1 Tax=Nocardioides ferulae TaxID=2340821 RepID=UPI000EAC41C1|nr:helix-turn-helix transcriptional regulator [Nocardioides ferulae]